MPIEYRDSYVKMDEAYGDQIYKLFGPSLLGFPVGTDGARLQMFGQEVKQHLSILNPDVPRIQTQNENTFGKHNRSYKRLDGEWEVVDRIDKFDNGFIYTLVLYNAERDLYDMIEKPIAENPTERYAFLYKTNAMDELKVGDKFKDKVLYKSTSYDENMNYRYGKNAKVYMVTSPDVLEDAVYIRLGWLRKIMFIQYGSWQIPVSPNNVPINWYGDDDHFQGFPHIGQMAKDDILCATRPVKKDHVRYDFQTKNLQDLMNIDTEYYVPDNSVLCDMEVYYNGEDEFPDNVFFHQLKEVHDANAQYADRMYEWSTKIKTSGSNYTTNVTFYRSKYMHYNDKDYKWTNKDKTFGNILVDCKMIAIDGMDPGSKGSGRYGDKGVISGTAKDPIDFDGYIDPVEEEENLRKLLELPEFLQELARIKGIPNPDEKELEDIRRSIIITPDASMPYTDEFPVDICLNACGAVRRENIDQLYEVELNFCSWWIQKKVQELDTLEEKISLILEYLEMLNVDQYKFFKELYESFEEKIEIDGYTFRLMNRSEQEKFVADVEKHGFYIAKPVDSNIRFDTLKAIYEKYDFIKPLPMYIDIFGTKKRRLINDGIVADKYFMFLIHNNNKNFSARSTFRVNRSNLPTKDIAKRTGRSPYSHNPVRLGEYYNLMADISGATLAEMNIPMRSSVLGMKSLQRILEATGNPLAVTRIKIQDNYVNANAQIAAAKLKALGIKLIFHRDNIETHEVIRDAIMPLHVGGYTIYDTPLNKETYVNLFRAFNDYLKDIVIMESYPGEKQDIAWEYVFGLDEFKDSVIIDQDMKDMLLSVTKRKHIDNMKKKNIISDEEYEELIASNSSKLNDIKEEVK